MFDSSSIIVGLEIGTSKICAVAGDMNNDGGLNIIGIGQAPSRGVRKGEIVDFETAMKCVHEAVVDAEQKSDVMIRSVFVAIAETRAGENARCSRSLILTKEESAKYAKRRQRCRSQ